MAMSWIYLSEAGIPYTFPFKAKTILFNNERQVIHFNGLPDLKQNSHTLKWTDLTNKTMNS